jgi:rod shape-determining protein MreD
MDVAGGVADVLLLALLSIALLRGAVVGAAAGFFGGLLVDVLTLDTLGVTALLYSLAGYWAGRYGETTGRGRRYAPPLAAFALSIAAMLGGVAVHFLLDQPVSAREALVTLLPSALFAAVLILPVYGLCRWVVAPVQRYEPAQRVELV